MSEDKTDRRIKYSKAMLRQSLLELMSKKDISKITVTDICANADINRGTFYKYYRDPEELLSIIEEELYLSIDKAMSVELRGECQRAFPNSEIIYQIISCIYENSDLARVLLGEYGDIDFLFRIISMAQRQCVEEWGSLVKNDRLAKYMYAYTSGGSLSILRCWISEGMRETPEEISKILDNMVKNGLSRHLELKEK